MAQVCGDSVDKVMSVSMEQESMDNLSVVILSFENFTRYLESIEPQQGKVSAQRNRSQTNVLPESISQMSTQKGAD